VNGGRPFTFAVTFSLLVAEPVTKVVNGEAGVVETVGGWEPGPTAVTFRSEVAVRPAASVAVTRKPSVKLSL